MKTAKVGRIAPIIGGVRIGPGSEQVNCDFYMTYSIIHVGIFTPTDLRCFCAFRRIIYIEIVRLFFKETVISEFYKYYLFIFDTLLNRNYYF